MTHNNTPRAIRFVLTAVLAILTVGCSDVPSGPPSSGQRPDVEIAQRGAADAPMRTDGPVAAQGTESIRRRTVRLKDGTAYVIESITDAGGLPHRITVSRGGQAVARLDNEWRRTARGYVLERQRLARFDAGRATLAADSREFGGMSALVEEPVIHAWRVGTTRATATGLSLAGRMRSLDEGAVGNAGPCDEQARVVEAAIDDWLLSVLATAGGVVSVNPVVTWTAYAYQLKKYRDMTRAEEALDQCVDSAGRREDDM
jgi:hypothetical protein